jgi:protein required for attachment to host cells
MVGDGEKALFLENIGDEKDINLAVVRTLEHENPPTREQGSDRPGRYNDGVGAHRSAVEDTDWHHLEKERFAKEIADRLYKAAHSGRFKHIVIAAPPLILGELRKELHKEVRDRLLLELDKELTKLPVHEIEARITAA